LADPIIWVNAAARPAGKRHLFCAPATVVTKVQAQVRSAAQPGAAAPLARRQRQPLARRQRQPLALGPSRCPPGLHDTGHH